MFWWCTAGRVRNGAACVFLHAWEWCEAVWQPEAHMLLLPERGLVFFDELLNHGVAQWLFEFDAERDCIALARYPHDICLGLNT